MTPDPLFEADHPMRPGLSRLLTPLADYLSYEALTFAVFFAPAVPLAVCSVWRAHAAPKQHAT